jgi:hypothetical protein
METYTALIAITIIFIHIMEQQNRQLQFTFYQHKSVRGLHNFQLCSRNNQHYALNCTTSSFNILAPTCFGSSLPSSGSFRIRLSYMKRQIDFVVYYIMYGYVVCVRVCWCSNTRPSCANLRPKRVGASILNKGVVQFSA